MEKDSLKTMTEIAEKLNRPAHRIIHLCQSGMVVPTVDAAGRGSVRRFSRDDTLKILVALQMQELEIQAPLIKPLMRSLDRLMEIREIKEFRKSLVPFDLVEVICRRLGSEDHPVLAFVTPKDHVALVTPRFFIPPGRDLPVELHSTDRHLLARSISIVVNLTDNANRLANTLWAE